MKGKRKGKEKREVIKLGRDKRVVSESVSGATREGQEEQRKERGHAKHTCRTFKMMDDET